MNKRILYLCTHNSCRSQLAEALTNHLLGDRYVAYSAGTRPSGINPMTLAVLEERGIETTGLRSKSIEEFSGISFDAVITLCDDANETCPLFMGGVKRIHRGFSDPSRTSGSDDEIRQAFRRVRDEMEKWIVTSLEEEIG